MNNVQRNNGDVGNDVNLLEYWYAVKKRKILISIIVLATVISSAIISLFLPVEYRTMAVIMPAEAGSAGNGSVLFAALMGALPFGGGANVTADKQILAILRSRTFTEKVVDRLNQKGIFDVGHMRMVDAVASIKGMVSIQENTKESTISIVATSRDPVFATKVANIYVEKLQEFINSNALTSARRNRIFVQKQLEDNKRALLEVGKEINEFYKGDRVSNIDSRVDILINEPYNYQFGTNFELIKDASNMLLGGSKSRIWEAALTNRGKKFQSNSEANIVRGIPQQVYLQYLTLRRELMAKLNVMLTQQYEMAKIEEHKEDLVFQLIDPAYKPEGRFRPNRKNIVVMSFVMSMLFATLLAIFLENLEKMKARGRVES